MVIREYHERTKHHVTRHAPGPGWLDWAIQPDPFRSFIVGAAVEDGRLTTLPPYGHLRR